MAASFAALLAHAPSHVPPPESLHRHEHSHDGEHHCIHEKLTPATAHGIAPQAYGDATEKALSSGGAGGARLPLRIVINDDSLFADEHACLLNPDYMLRSCARSCRRGGGCSPRCRARGGAAATT